MDAVLTKEELAKRWKCSESAINKLVMNGIITPARHLPGWKVSMSQVLELEGTTLDPMSPIQKRRLEKTIRDQQARINQLEAILSEMCGPVIRYLNAKNGGKDHEE
jgi:hypothetical protein